MLEKSAVAMRLHLKHVKATIVNALKNTGAPMLGEASAARSTAKGSVHHGDAAAKVRKEAKL